MAKKKKAGAKKPVRKYAKRKASAPKRRTIVKRKPSIKMAKKRKTSRRRRSVGSAGGNEMQVILGAVVGNLGQQLIASKLADKINPKLIGAGSAVAGFFGAKKLKSPLTKGIAIGFAAGGALSLARSTGIIQGVVGAADDVVIENMGELDDIAGADGLDYVSGPDDQLDVLAGAGDWEDQLGRMEDMGYSEGDY